jgi:AcrR family transcriptional regulator
MTRGDKRQQIMAAAEKLFTSRRFHEITLDEVARAASVGKGTIYLHFENKEDLFFQTLMSGFDDLCGILNRRVPDGAPFDRQLVSACAEISGFFAKRRHFFCLMQTEDARMTMCRGGIRERWMEHRKRLIGALAGILAKGVDEGAVRSDVAPDVLATFLLGMLRTRARDLKGAPDNLQRHELLVDLFTRGAGTSLTTERARR